MQHAAEEEGALAFFRAQHKAFSDTLSEWRGRADMVPALMSLACSSFEGNLAFQAEGQPEIACHKGCSACCTVRVIATAPEVLLASRYIRSGESVFLATGIDLVEGIRQADAATRHLSEKQRIALRRRCPFISRGICVIYPVRPLACRGHASRDKKACADAAAGSIDSIPFSMPHMMVRSLIQNAIQSALRDFDVAWAVYEYNHALSIALSEQDCEKAWMDGKDVFAAAQVNDVNPGEMAEIFDSILGKRH